MIHRLAAGIRIIRHLIALFFFFAAAPSVTDASELSIGAHTIQKMISEQLFNRQGRWYILDDGPCYAFLESPHTRLQNGRLVLDAHMSSRVGLRIGGNCVGSGFASNVTLSGRLVGKGSTLTIDDIRFDHVDDSAARDVVDLIQNAAPQALPHAVNLDVLTYVRGAPMNASGIPVTVKQFRIVDVGTQTDAVVVHFDMSLATP
jgi:hypothetical protein